MKDNSDTISLLREILVEMNVIAALLHDVGKAYYYFQLKLALHAGQADQKKVQDEDKQRRGDPARHELLSYQIASYLFSPDKNQDTFAHIQLALARVTDTKALGANFELPEDIVTEAPSKISELWKPRSQHFFSPVLYLILTHHRIPEDTSGQSVHKTYLNSFSGVEPYSAVYQTYENQKGGLDSAKIFDALIACLQSLHDKLSALSDASAQTFSLFVDPQRLITMAQYLLRPSLILSDQFFSSVEQDHSVAPTIADDAFANTVKRNTENALNQSLAFHLDGVAKQTQITTQFLLNAGCKWDEVGLPKLEKAPDALTAINPNTPARFAWQNAAQKSIEQKLENETQDYGFIAFMMAKTGSGKTLGNIKVMSAAKKHRDLRVSCLLGMRSLTMETFHQYQQFLQIDVQQIAGVIGNDLAEKLFKEGLHNIDEHSNYEEAKSDSEYVAVKDGRWYANDLPTALASLRDDSKIASIFMTPILACTIDYMVNAINSCRSNKSKYLFRLMTSDLIIDEIDSYSDVQMVSILRLVALAAMYGNKVVVSSATLTPQHIELLKRAYEYGRNFYCKNKQIENITYGGIYTHEASIMETTDLDALPIEETLQRFHDRLLSSPGKHYFDYLALPTSSLSAVYKSIFSAAVSMADKHTADLPTDYGSSIQLSTGLIKLANVKHVKGLSKRVLLGEFDDLVPDDVLLKIECYHSKNLDIKKSVQERILGQLLTRKSDTLLCQTPKYKSLASQAHNSGKNRVLVLVIASPIIDTGRDFDFDFAVTEFRDHRGLIQTAGRVLRHRELDQLSDRQIGPNNPTMLILDRSLRYYDNKSKPEQFAFPGFQHVLTDIDMLSKDDQEKTVSAWLGFSDNEPISAAVMLSKSSRGAGRELEQRGLNQLMTSDEFAPQNMFSSKTVVTTKLADSYEFREQDKEHDRTANLYIENDKLVTKPNLDNGRYMASESIPIKLLQKTYPRHNYLLVDQSVGTIKFESVTEDTPHPIIWTRSDEEENGDIIYCEFLGVGANKLQAAPGQ